ncbi:hypothetical protein LCGC14_1867210 [marine sediment metagenome]|uniref:Uncharacterized protein n=1 Tax=marine sediment metagenome TaxID=412755 RepID=A0A0F9J4T2_9ZZZZ
MMQKPLFLGIEYGRKGQLMFKVLDKVEKYELQGEDLIRLK